jgi:hypothetical protein
LHLERLWDRNIAITTRLVDTVTTPMLLKTVQSHMTDPKRLITHYFKLDKIMDAYDTFERRPRQTHSRLSSRPKRGEGEQAAASPATPAITFWVGIRLFLTGNHR